MVTTKTIKAGEEIFINYEYVEQAHPLWGIDLHTQRPGKRISGKYHPSKFTRLRKAGKHAQPESWTSGDDLMIRGKSSKNSNLLWFAKVARTPTVSPKSLECLWYYGFDDRSHMKRTQMTITTGSVDAVGSSDIQPTLLNQGEFVLSNHIDKIPIASIVKRVQMLEGDKVDNDNARCVGSYSIR